MLGKTTSLEIRTPEGVRFHLPIASPFSRCLALAIDFALVLALSILMMQVVNLFSQSLSQIPVIGRVFTDFGTGLLILGQFFIKIFYGILLEWKMKGQTLGKRVFGLRVIDERGLPLSFKQVVIRNLFRFLDILPSLFYLLGGIACFVTPRCQRLGDIAAGTLVVRETQARPLQLEGTLTTDSRAFAGYPHLEARLRQKTSPEEARIAFDAVVRRDELHPESRLTLFAQLADHFREIQDFPEEATIGLSNEQYVRNVVGSLFRRTIS